MRGVISAGAVTALEDLRLAQRFDAVYGVSAGALACAYMLAGQAAMGTSIYFDDLPAAHFVRALRILAARPPIALDAVIDETVARRKRLDVAAVEDARPEFHVLATCLRTPCAGASARPAARTIARCGTGAAPQRPAGAPQRLPPLRRRAAEPAAGRAGGRRRRHPHPGAAHPPRRRARQTPRPRRTGDAQLAAPRAPGDPIDAGRTRRPLRTPAAALPAGVTAHGDAQVQVIVPHAAPMSQSEMNPFDAARRRLDGPHERRAHRRRTGRPSRACRARVVLTDASRRVRTARPMTGSSAPARFCRAVRALT